MLNGCLDSHTIDMDSLELVEQDNIILMNSLLQLLWLHWHKSAEWALMLNGSVRLSAVNEEGQNFVDDPTISDVWFFPVGIPHSIQAFENSCEFPSYSTVAHSVRMRLSLCQSSLNEILKA